MESILLAEESEKTGNVPEALRAYQAAVPAMSDSALLSERIKRLEQIMRYRATYEKGVAAEKAGQWQEAAAAFREAREIAPQADISVTELIKRTGKNPYCT